jgi:hypothetical protein
LVSTSTEKLSRNGLSVTGSPRRRIRRRSSSSQTRTASPYSAAKVAVSRSDYEFLISPQARELVDGERITVIDYRPLQEVWASSTSR